MRERIFHTIQNNETAYWLGFLAADGSIFENKLTVGLSTKDVEHLKALKSFLQSDNTITTRLNDCNNGKQYSASYFTIKSWDLIEDLSYFQIVPNKSSKNIDFLENISDKYKEPFICGYFDGDGWFSNTEKSKNFGFCGNEMTMISINNFLCEKFNWEYKNKISSEHNSEITFKFSVSAKNKMLDFIIMYLSYKNSCPLLQRKQEAAMNIKNYYNEKEIKAKTKIKKQECKRIISTNYNKICPICKKEFSTSRFEAKFCSYECANKAQQKVERPSREELKALIRITPFTKLGEKFGVSDNAIRKWCDAYGLPRKVTEIKQYSQEQWDKI